MASIYGGTKGRRGSIYKNAPKHDGGGSSVGGLVGNLASDATDAIMGAVPGVVAAGRAVGSDLKGIVTDPGSYRTTKTHTYQDVLAPIGQSYKQTYRPLFQGDFGEFANQVYKHPLGPILDLATIISLGAGAGTKAGLLSSVGKTVELRSPGAIAGQAAKTLVKPTDRKGALLDKFLKQFPADTPMVGEFARYAKELDRIPHRDAMALRLRVRPYQRAYRALSEGEQIALGLIGRGVAPAEYKALLLREQAAGRAVEAKTIKLMDRKDVQAAYASPSPRLLDAVEKARAVGETAASILEGKGRLTAEVAADRPYLDARIASGAKFEPETPLVEGPAASQGESLFAEDVGRVAPGEVNVGALVRAGDRGNVGRVVAIDGDIAKVHFINRSEGTKATATLRVDELSPMSAAEAGTGPLVLKGGKSIEDLKAEFAATGRVQPFYLPDKALPEKSFFGRAGGGFGVPKSPVHRTEGLNFRAGMIALQPDLLSAEYLKTVKFALHDDIHAVLMDSAVKVAKGEGLPEGFVYIRRPVGKSNAPEKIGYQEKARGDFRRQLDDLLPTEDSPTPALTTRELGEALEQNGHYLAVPKSYAREAAGEFLRSSRAVQWFLAKPTAVWRALVLNLRPAWLVNNMVGNHLLYAVRFAGKAGLKAYVNAVRSSGFGAKLHLGKGDGVSQQFMEELFPEQVEGTFVNTQRPGRRQKAQDRLSLGLAPLDKGVEGTLRRGATEAVLRKTPAVKAKLRAMPKQTRSFEAAAKQALENDPILARRVSDKVNDALGDFLNLSPTERGVVRAAFPFYAWYKAIAKVTIRLPLDAPLRANILVNLGMIGAEEARAKLGAVPDFLLGIISLGRNGDRERVVDTSKLSPWTTIPQLGADVSGTVNPFIEAPARALLGKDKFTPVSLADAFKTALINDRDVAAGLPQYRLYQAFTGKLYRGEPGKPTLTKRDPLSELLMYLGVPVKEISPQRAQELKTGG